MQSAYTTLPSPAPEPIRGPQPGPLSPSGHPQAYAYTAPKVLYDRFKARLAFALAVIQIVAAALCIIFNSVAINVYSEVSMVGYGIWGGVICMVTGILGICASKTKTKCKVVTFMVLCIVSATACIFILIFGVVGALHSSYAWQDPEVYCKYSHNSGMDRYGNPCPSSLVPSNRPQVRMAMNVMIALLAVLEAIVSIWASTLCCKVACCGQRNPIMIPVQYIPMQGNAQFVVMAPSQQGGGPMIIQPGAPYPGYQPVGSTGLAGYEGAIGGHTSHAPSASGEACGPPMYTAFPPQYNEEKVALP